MHKYPSLNYPDDPETDGVFAEGEIVVQEKLDGANFRFCLEDNLSDEYHTDWRDIVCGSRNVAYKNPEDESNQFGDTIEYLRDNVDADTVRSIQDEFGELTFFGESMENPHTIKEYDFGEIPLFIGFDIWQHDEGRFLPQEEAEHLFDRLGLDVSPVIDIVRAEAWDDYEFEVPESQYGDVQAEGVVFKNHSTDTYAKFVRADFKERNNKSFNSKPKESTDAVKLSRSYITNARIEKTAHKLVDEGPYDSLQMEMMEELPEAVIRDMASEEAGTIFMEERYDELDIGEFRSDVASRCAEVLKGMLARRRKEAL